MSFNPFSMFKSTKAPASLEEAVGQSLAALGANKLLVAGLPMGAVAQSVSAVTAAVSSLQLTDKGAVLNTLRGPIRAEIVADGVLLAAFGKQVVLPTSSPLANGLRSGSSDVEALLADVAKFHLKAGASEPVRA